MGGKMPENLIPVLYSFTNDRNLYNSQINPSVYIILHQRYLERFTRENSSHTLIFKYTKGMRITYFSDPLALNWDMFTHLGNYHELKFDYI